MTLAENVKALRIARGLSQTELAESIGVSYPRISDIERAVGNPTLQTIEKLAGFFGISSADLLSPKKFQET